MNLPDCLLFAENDYRSAAFTSSHIQLLQLLCSQAALSIDNARLYAALSEYNASLEQQVHVRTAELEEKNRQLSLAKEAAEAATKAKADFLSNMSHEIRTPMNAVLGVGRLLADTQLSLEQQQLVSMISNSGHLLLTIINDILDYSKIEAGQLTLNYSSHNIADVVESAVLLCYDMASNKGLTLCWFIDPALPPAIMMDSTRLQQVLLNCLSHSQQSAGKVQALFACVISHFVSQSLFCLFHSAFKRDQGQCMARERLRPSAAGGGSDGVA